MGKFMVYSERRYDDVSLRLIEHCGDILLCVVDHEGDLIPGGKICVITRYGKLRLMYGVKKGLGISVDANGQICVE